MTPAQQLNEKLKLERKLAEKLAPYNREIVRGFMRSYGVDAAIPDMAEKDQELADILNGHYIETADKFIPVITDKMPDDVAVTDEENSAIVAALAAFFTVSALREAAQINATTAREMDRAVSVAIQSTTSLHESASVAGVQINRDLKSRVGSIATTETQLGAEFGKLTASEVLIGAQPTVSGGGATQTDVRKTWWSVGDSHVRPAHLDADGQEVPMNDPFVVGGEQLMVPRDSSRGATAGNVINCRCGAEYSTDTIIAERRAKL